MTFPLELPLSPMLAKAATKIPVEGDFVYEPKWDGFRALLISDAHGISIQSRSGKQLTTYFPEVVAMLDGLLPQGSVLDGEIVCPTGDPGDQSLDWDVLSARVHPAASRIAKLSETTPATVIIFDLLALEGENMTPLPFEQRRERLEEFFSSTVGAHEKFVLTQTTSDHTEAQRWFTEFEGAGLDGVIAKDAQAPYEQGKRSMIKIKHRRTAEAVVVGYRIHKSGNGVGSLLLGLYDEDGTLNNVGGISAFTAARRLELIDELADLVIRDDEGNATLGETARSRFSSGKDISFIALRPERVVEVAFDQLEGRRFRHAVSFLRWRPDRVATSCTMDQVDRAPSYDLGQVLTTPKRVA